MPKICEGRASGQLYDNGLIFEAQSGLITVAESAVANQGVFIPSDDCEVKKALLVVTTAAGSGKESIITIGSITDGDSRFELDILGLAAGVYDITDSAGWQTSGKLLTKGVPVAFGAEAAASGEGGAIAGIVLVCGPRA